MKYHQPYGILDTNAPYINGDPSIGRQGSIPPAESIEYPQREIVSSIQNANLVPTDASLAQLWQSTQINPWLTHVAHDYSGTANLIIADIEPPPTSLFFGMQVRIRVASTCSGPSQLNLNSLGLYSVVRGNGAATDVGDFYVGEVLALSFDGGKWQIENWLGPPGVPSTVNNFTFKIPYAVAGGTANALTASFTPVVTALNAGDPFLVKAILKNLVGPVTLAANALPPHPITWPDGAPLVRGDIHPNAIMLLVYDGANFQVISVQSPNYIKGFDCYVQGLGVPESTFARVSPATANMANSLDASSFANGVFTVGDGEAGWWVFAMDGVFFPYAWSPIGNGAAWVTRITGPHTFFAQHNLNGTGNQGNSAAVSCVVNLNVGDQMLFDYYHMLGQGYCNIMVHGARIGSYYAPGP